MLTIITVNYNGADETLALLRSLERQTDHSFAVMVIDNDSAPNDREQLSAYASTAPFSLQVIFNDTNLGFSGGNNRGIRRALAQDSRWVLLLNNDTAVDTDYVETLRAQLPNKPGILGVSLQEGERTAYAGQVRWLSSTLPHDHVMPKNSAGHYAIGGAVAIHQEVFTRIGLLDERFFLYFEDAEYSVRAQRAGFPITFLAHPEARHTVSASTSRLGSTILLRYHIRNAHLFNGIHGPWWVRIVLPFWSLVIMVKQLIKFMVQPAHRPQARALTMGVLDYYANRFGRIS